MHVSHFPPGTSHVLGRVAQALREDFEVLYGYRPWLLETFVDEREHTGVSLGAANWVRAGESAGPGRQDRTHTAPETHKAVYLYELEPAWRERLGVSAPGVAPLAASEGLDAGRWAGNEFGGAPLGDARLSALGRERAPYGTVSDARRHRRRERSARSGQRALPAHRPARRQCGDGRAHSCAPSRAHAAAQGVGVHGAVCSGHHQRELHPARPNARAEGDWLEPDRRADARVAPAHHLGGQHRVASAGGAAGRIRRATAPDPETTGPKARDEKKSWRWVEGLHDCAHAAHKLPETRVVCTMDREADILDLFVEHRTHAANVELLVGAKVNRVLGKNTTAEGDQVVRRLFDEVRNAPARGSCNVEVSRQSARVKASKQAPKRAAPRRRYSTRRSRCGWCTPARSARLPMPRRWSGSCSPPCP